MRAAAIIIGIGGIGSDICARVERMLPPDAPENRYFRFVIMDTDRNTIRRLQSNGFGGTAIMLSDNMTVDKCREMLKDRGLADWYPESGTFANKAMTEGAGQYRSISRLAFEYAVQETKLDVLNRLIHDLNELDTTSTSRDKQPMRFYVICSMAGGTGSGIALPLGLYINRIYMEQMKEALFNCKGFFALSSAMHELGGSRLERESIDANAYAAVKEISAYMRKADERRYYENPESFYKEEPETTYIDKGKIYDYCYLFGMTNGNGETLHSFEDLKDLMANAVYMQACSPMHDMNSSLEDNTINHLKRLARQTDEMFLRRFGGIGCGELQYPYQRIKEYLAMRWAQDMMGEHWQKYDRIFYQKVEEQEKKRRQGKKAESVDQGTEYISAIAKAGSDPLAEEILLICRPDEGSPVWIQYLEAMYDKITQDIMAGFEAEKKRGGSLVNQCDRLLAALMNSHNPAKQKTRARNDLYGMLQKLAHAVEVKSKREADGYAKTWFVPHTMDDSLKPFQLEFWLIQQGQTMHPNAVRYFLYQLRTEILSAQSREEQTIAELTEIIERINGHRNTKNNPFKGNRFYERAYTMYEKVFSGIFEYAIHNIYKGVLVRAYGYVDGLAKGYEKFFGSCDELLERFKRGCDEIEAVLDHSMGICLSYVCADEECRERLFEEIKHSIYYAQAGGGVSAYIYQLIQTQHFEEKWEKKIYEQFKSYWTDNMETEFGDIIDMDIIEAMEKQEFYKKGRRMDINYIKQYISEVGEKMVEPFLQYVKRSGRQQGISVCCYNVGMREKDDVHRQIARWLDDRRGVADEHYCSKYQIMFYRSMVGLKASEIMEFYHRHCYDAPLRKGEAFRAYESDIRTVYQQDKKGIAFTPHIDKNWHSFLEMPDAEQAYQEEVELQIGTVFYYSCIVEWECVNRAEYSFSIDREKGIIGTRTLWEWHRYLYQNQGAVRILAEGLLEDVIRHRDGNNSDILEGLKQGKMFIVFLRYFSEIDISEQGAIRLQPLLKAMAIILGLYVESQNELREVLDTCFTREKLKEWKGMLTKQLGESRAKRIINAYKNLDKYVEHIDAAEIYQLCTQLFCIEMGAAREKMRKDLT